ncbi:transcriptional elongation regulator MINIYO [Punica granatum]|uniref:Uncharacterized protein n=2 Tax=Punica granatum TaxID=22663 RepID=A0A218XI19_PUNGR|nr:transcriptional elongation regulator MINIYO [Punica granatum]OWM83992.1 hypothetical protein CDL15_Pgr004423 [Punica granatum]PKI64879.1 hypothetical protein CRG98_014722 [Punica granatum]
MERNPKRNGTKTPKPQTLHKIIANSKLQINEDDASRLIGSIIEKGVSDDPKSKPFAPISAPKPSVLPFPVARHRSHGPHWGPTVARRIDDDGDDSDEDEEDKKMLAAADRMAAFAGPVQRKERKGMALTNWRELVSFNDSSDAKRIKESSHAEARVRTNNREDINAADKRNARQDSTSLEPLSGTSKTSNNDLGSEVGTSVVNMKLDNADQGTNLKTDKCFRRDSEPVIVDDKQIDADGMAVDDARNGQSNMSLESQIDAENVARLHGMSSDEIAEAQAEIIDKLDPALLEALKRRGLEKLKKKNNLNSAGLASSSKLGSPPVDTESNIEVSSHLESADSHFLTSTSTKPNHSSQGITAAENKGPIGSNLWNAWSKKVEGVRNLRFSLDGNVVNIDTSPVPETNSTSAQNRQSADNVAGRDFLRTEGDPGAAGYTIKEAVALSRSVVPGQRSLALHLLASVLDKAINNVAQDQPGLNLAKVTQSNDHSVDWKAVWAFALGPEPELVLSLRMALDDNHNSVVLACAKVIQCILSFDLNEHFFDNLENIDVHGMDVYTAPVFRSKPEIDVGFLHAGFWKYSAKSSNLLPFGETSDEDTEGKHTIQDDVVVAGQDFTAGLIRMGILPRIRYLLEMDPTSLLEERLISILVAIARHSPIGANAIIECPRLVPTVVNRFNATSNMEINQSKIRSVTLLKVLAKSDRRACIEFINNGTFIMMTKHLYQSARSLDQWIKSGKESCRLSAALMVEQLRLWKVCIRYGFCLSNFTDIFPSICLWLYPPSIDKLLEVQTLQEFASVSKEAYLVLGALASRLPEFRLQMHEKDPTLQGNGGDSNSETWSWSYVGPMVDLGLKWLTLKSDVQLSELFELGDGSKKDLTLQDKSMSASLLWVYSAVMQMLSAILEKLGPKNTSNGGARLAWLPDFVPRIGLELLKNGFLGSLSSDDSVNNEADQTQGGSFIEGLCYLRLSNSVTSLASVCCLNGLIRVAEILDRLICLAKAGVPTSLTEGLDPSREGQILEKGILKGCIREIRSSLDIFLNLVTSEWQYLQSIETIGRGGPAPGVGVGWGASGGGFWSINVLLAQKDAAFLIYLLKITDVALDEDQALVSQRINAALGSCLVFGPTDKAIVEKALDFLLQVPVLGYLSICIQQFAGLNRSNKLVLGEYREEDLLQASNLLSSHFRNRWLRAKKKGRGAGGSKASVVKAHEINTSLETIHEDLELNENADNCDYDSLMMEWAYQRLPLPVHWFLSPISTIDFAKLGGERKSSSVVDLVQEPADLCEVAKAGLLFILGIEAMSHTQLINISSVVTNVPLVWKFHSLSMILLTGMDVLEDEKSRVLYEALQDLFGQLLDQARCSGSGVEMEKKNDRGFSLRFQLEIHDSYPTFIETIVEQFGAVSYGDLLYGRQVALYLHCHVEASVRLAAWNALSTARVFELLPPLEKSLAAPEGYLEPAEDNEEILEAYVKSWTSGALDRAATRRSLAFTLFLHHTSSFLFLNYSTDKVLLRNKLVKSLLRDYSRKHQHEGFMLDLIQYNRPPPNSMVEQEDVALPVSDAATEQRFRVVADACEGNASLLAEVEKLRSALLR